MDWWTEGWEGTDGKRSQLCTRFQDHLRICHLLLSWWCPHCCLGDQADIWGFWPGERLWHPYCGRRRAGGRPKDCLSRVSGSSLTFIFFAFNLFFVLQVLLVRSHFHFCQSCTLSFFSSLLSHVGALAIALCFPAPLSSFPPAITSYWYSFAFISSPSDAVVHEK